MSFFNLVSWLKRRPFQGTDARRGKRRARFATQFIHLEERCVPAAPTLVGTVGSLSQVLATPLGLPEKYVTITNNANYPVYPIFYDANSTVDPTPGAGTATLADAVVNASAGSYYNIRIRNPILMPIEGQFTIQIDGERMRVVNLLPVPTDPTIWTVIRGFNSTPAAHNAGARITVPTGVSLYDPQDPLNNTYRGYVGELIGGQVVLGLQPGHSLTVQVPLVFWDGGRLFFAYNNATPLNAGDAGDPTQDNGTNTTYTNTWHFNKQAPAFIALATYFDPAKGAGSNNPDGRVMWYHDYRDKTTAPSIGPFDFGTDGPGQLSEWTIRDPQMIRWAPNTPATQIQTIFNYDVSYVDNLTLPAAMESPTFRSRRPGLHHPIIPTDSYGWLGSDLSILQMQQAMNEFTLTDPTTLNSLLGNYFAGRGYDQFFEPAGLRNYPRATT